MTLPEIDKILKQDEGLRIEFISARNKIPASFYETAVSFSNTDRGMVLFGVNDEALVEGDGFALYQKQLSSFRINISGERLAIIMAKVIMVSIYAETGGRKSGYME